MLEEERVRRIINLEGGSGALMLRGCLCRRSRRGEVCCCGVFCGWKRVGCCCCCSWYFVDILLKDWAW